MRLPKQLGQIFQLVEQLYDDTSYPVGMAVDEFRIDSGDVAGVHKFLLIREAGSVNVLKTFSYFFLYNSLSKHGNSGTAAGDYLVCCHGYCHLCDAVPISLNDW